MSDENEVDFGCSKGVGGSFAGEYGRGFLSLCVSNVVVRQGSATSDGFLSRAEYSLWSSTMKLHEDEAHPILKQSHFMSLPSDQPPQVSFFLFPCFYVASCGGLKSTRQWNMYMKIKPL